MQVQFSILLTNYTQDKMGLHHMDVHSIKNIQYSYMKQSGSVIYNTKHI